MNIRNHVSLHGNVGAAPDIRYNPDGSVVAKFSIATSDKWQDKSGQWKERTSWHTIRAWGEMAKSIERKVTKGTAITISGKLDYDNWEDKSGVKHNNAYILLIEYIAHPGKERE